MKKVMKSLKIDTFVCFYEEIFDMFGPVKDAPPWPGLACEQSARAVVVGWVICLAVSFTDENNHRAQQSMFIFSSMF